jgi:hypothetical protein
MEISLKRQAAELSTDKLAAAALHPGGQGIRPNQLLRAAGLTGRRDRLPSCSRRF